MKTHLFVTMPLAIMLLALPGCSRTVRLHAPPEPLVRHPAPAIPASVGITKVELVDTSPPYRTVSPFSMRPDELGLGFCKRLHGARIFQKAFYPVREDDEYDLTIEYVQTMHVDLGKRFGAAAIGGVLTLGLSTPALPYDYEVTASGRVDVLRAGQVIRSYEQTVSGVAVIRGPAGFPEDKAMNLLSDELWTKLSNRVSADADSLRAVAAGTSMRESRSP